MFREVARLGGRKWGNVAGVMDEAMVKELESYKRIARNWKESYLGWLSKDVDDNSYIVDDMIEDLNTFMAPTMRRFRDLEYMSGEELTKFQQEIMNIVEELREEIKKFDGGE